MLRLGFSSIRDYARERLGLGNSTTQGRCLGSEDLLVVIGEVKAIPDAVSRAAPEIPWADIRGMRNKVAHEYFGVDVKVLWQTIREDLPALLATLRMLAARSDLP